MSNIIIASNPIVTTEYHTDKNLLYQTIHQPARLHSELFRESLNEGLKALKKYRVCKWLTADNSRDNRTSEILEWIENEWAQQAIQAGCKYRANVVRRNNSAPGTVSSIPGLQMREFTHQVDALNWLDSLPDN